MILVPGTPPNTVVVAVIENGTKRLHPKGAKNPNEALIA